VLNVLVSFPGKLSTIKIFSAPGAASACAAMHAKAASTTTSAATARAIKDVGRSFVKVIATKFREHGGSVFDVRPPEDE
jgi:hypothetical protein